MKQKHTHRNLNHKGEEKINYNTIIVGVILLVVLVGIGVFWGISSYGKAITITAPQATPINLDAEESATAKTPDVPEFTVVLTPSGEKKAAVLIVEPVSLSSGLLQYTIKRNVTNTIIEQGLLGTVLTESDDILVGDNDNTPDFNLKLSGNMFTVTNLNYILPAYSTITVLDDKLAPTSEKFFSVEKGKLKILYFNVTSTKTPEVSATFKGGTKLSATETNMSIGKFSVSNTTTNSILMKLEWNSSEEKPYILEVTATVGDKITTNKYLFAVNGLMIKVNDPAYPSFTMRSLGGSKYQLEYVLQQTNKSQPFSLPCGEIDLKSHPAIKNISKVYRYNKGVQQWIEGKPSEFTKLGPKQGYLIDLKNNAQLFLNVTCDKSGESFSDWVALPSLNPGWNFMGIGGYEAISVDKVIKEASGIGTVEITGINIGSGEISGVTELSPGKAYWVNVKGS